MPLHEIDAGGGVVQCRNVNTVCRKQAHAPIEPSEEGEIRARRCDSEFAVIYAHRDHVVGSRLEQPRSVETECGEASDVGAQVLAVHIHIGLEARTVELK